MLSYCGAQTGRPDKKAVSCNIWLISNKVHPQLNSVNPFEDVEPDRVLEYTISDLARYMLKPDPIQVKNRLIGCKIIYKKPSVAALEHKIKLFFSRFFRKKQVDISADTLEETIISDQFNPPLPEMKDPALRKHVDRIKALLVPYDPFFEKIAALDPAKIAGIAGVCDGPEGNRIEVNLDGTIPRKIEYIIGHLQKEIGIVLAKAYMGKGMFDLRGFDFESYYAGNAYRLVIAVRNGQYEAYVITPKGGIDFRVEDTALVKYLHFFQSSLKTNCQLCNLLNESVQGRIRPLRLLLTKELEIDYFKTDLPEVYKEVLDANTITLEAKKTIVQALNRKQVGILVTYLPDVNQDGQAKTATRVYVMHHVEALAAVKETLPHLYKQIDQKLGVLETEKYYLMDSIKV